MRFALALAVLLCGCGGGEAPPPANQARPTLAQLGPEECRRFGSCYRFAGGQCRHVGEDECTWLPAQRMRGGWRTGHELSEFVPDDPADRPRDELGAPQRIRLMLDPAIVLPLLGRAAHGGTVEVRVEFIGRRTRTADPAGGDGFGHRVEVQEMISARVVE